jgi:putative DNA methylase
MNGNGQHIAPIKKLIEVALPLDAINAASAREKSIRHGHPSTLHLWWARRPLAAARAVIFAQMVDDPSSHPERFPTEEDQEQERQRLFRLIEELVLWENTSNERVLAQARDEIRRSWRTTCTENQSYPTAKEMFDPEKLPAFHDPFAGGGALPLEAQRLGLESYASDLNPVAVLINKAMIEIPPRFGGRPPVNPVSRKEKTLLESEWNGTQGLADDVWYYGQWMRDEAEKRIGHLYPKVEITAEMAIERPDLKPSIGKKLTVIAWLWARTVKSPNPAFAQVDVPLASTFMLSTKEGKETYVEPVIEGTRYHFTVKVGKPKDAQGAKNGTKLARANFRCIMSGEPIGGDYIKDEGKGGRIGARLMAVVAEGNRGRIYLPPTEEIEAIARKAESQWVPDVTISGSTQYLGVKPYGMSQFSQLFTERQLLALTTFSDLAQEAREHAKNDAVAGSMPDDGCRLDDGGRGATAYADAIAVYLACAVSRMANYSSTLCVWSSHPKDELAKQVFLRQALQMTWDFAETNPFSAAGGTLTVNLSYLRKAMLALPAYGKGTAYQSDAASQSISVNKVISTDPPYFDNVPYADLSDFFYVWLRRSLKPVFPNLFSTLAVPKNEELVAFAYRHDGKAGAEAFFLDGMTRAMHRLAEQAHPAFPITIYYAFRQSETDTDEGTASSGWDTFLDAVIRAGFGISGTWPMRTEYTGNLKTKRNALASSIILVCRPRAADARIATRREFLSALKSELPAALAHLQRGNIAPVDLAQSAIGPGMAVYTRYSRVLDAEGNPLSVREALALINQILDEALAEQEGDFDADSRWALAWFEQSGFADGEYGVAETLSKAKNTSVSGMVDAGILASRGGKVRLLRPDELPSDWNPETDPRLTAWESVHHLVRALEAGGERAAAELVAKIGSKAEISRELAYRLYTVCERKKRAQEALSYNGLVQSWPEITRLARDGAKLRPQAQLFDQE